MRLLPRSLFGRTLLVLAAGLLLAQLATSVVNLLDRGSAVYRLGAQQIAQRIAQSARVLNRLDRLAREEVLDAIGSPDVRVSLSSMPVDVEKGPLEHDAYERAFATTLQRALGRPWPVKVEIIDSPRTRDAGDGGENALDDWVSRNFYFLLPGHTSLVVQVGLVDGTTALYFVRLPQERLQRLEGLLPRVLLWVGIVFLLGAALVGMVTRPLRRLADAAVALGADPERPPLDAVGPAEVRSVIESFNKMQSQVRAYILERTRMLGAISHDLKTPITRMRLRGAVAQHLGAQAKFVRDLEEMEAMVASTLEFFRALGKQERQPVDITALIDSLVEDWRELGKQVEFDGAARAAYPCHPEALRRCVNNLVENALRYGGEAHVRIDDGPAQLRITVRDAGPGIPEAELERVFEPYVRLEESRNRDSGGTGLGLSIARNIARWHGGEVKLANEAQGGGLVAELTLPRSRPA